MTQYSLRRFHSLSTHCALVRSLIHSFASTLLAIALCAQSLAYLRARKVMVTLTDYSKHVLILTKYVVFT